MLFFNLNKTEETKTSLKKFRKDINGLRAVAVLSVLLFHICSFNSLNDTKWSFSLGGGYVGVDIFFVISGFLMTAIIIKGLNSGNFSVLNFWKRRAKRICPALFVAVVLFYIIGYLLLVNVSEFYEYNKEATAALGFISNFRFAKDEGYFAVDSMSKMLLHTWSLSLEWQFYVIYPVLLWALKKFLGISYIKFAVLFLFVASLISAFIFTEEKNYYMLYTRAWELLAGGIVYLFPVNKLVSLSINYKRVLEVLGLILICSIFVRENNTVWTASLVMPSVIGTMLIIACAQEKSILGFGFFQYLGKISYSLYIYHWLVLSIFSRINLTNNLYITGTVILLLSMASFHFIESSRNYGWKFLILYFAMAGLTVYTVDQHGFKNRYDQDLIPPMGAEGSSDFEPQVNSKGTPKVAVLGDSHARQYWKFFKDNNIDAAFFISSASYCFNDFNCRFTKPMFKDLIEQKYGSLGNFAKARQKFLDNLNDDTAVIIAQRFTLYFENDINDWIQECKQNPSLYENPQNSLLDKDLGSLFNKNKNKHFYIVGNLIGSHAVYSIRECQLIKDNNKYLPQTILNSLSCAKQILKYDDKYKNINAFFKNYLKKYKNVTFIDPNALICKNGYCSTVTNNNEPLFFDDNHLSVAGAQYVGPYIMSFIDKK